MTSPRQSDPVVICLRRWMRRTQVIAGICFGLIGLAALGVALAEAGFVVGSIIAACCLPAAAYLLDVQAGRTILTAEGIQTWRPLLRHSCQWTDVSDTTQEVVTNRRTTTFIEVHRKTGRAFKLPAPIDDGEWGKSLVPEKLDMIRSYRHDAVPDTLGQGENAG